MNLQTQIKYVIFRSIFLQYNIYATMPHMQKEIYDVAIIGGGPAGLMTAGRAAELGAKVVLLEKNSDLGEKLLITGGGRCNVTNAEPDVRKFLSKYKDSDKFLFSAFSQFSVKDTIEFFNSRGMATKVEAEGRVFPTSNSARSVWTVLTEYMKKGGVEVKTNAVVTGFKTKDGNIISATLKNGEEIFAKNFVVATGGVSRPETGSTGDGFAWLEKLGHKISTPSDAMVPINLDMSGKNNYLETLQGVTLQDIKLTTFQNGEKQEVKKGKILFTHFGVSGPTIINMSKDVGELLNYGSVEIKLDLLPAKDHGMLNEALQKLFKIDDKKMIKNSLDKIIPKAMVEAVLHLSEIDGNTENNSVTREERMKLIETIKGITLYVKSLVSKENAIVSSGGVELSEIDLRTMCSKVVPNLYLVGDILNIDRPSGGYSLQLCWTTGFVAGSAAVK